MFKDTIVATLCKDVNKKIQVKTVVFQDLLWPGYHECRAFCDDGAAYAALFEGAEQLTKFVLCPKEGK